MKGICHNCYILQVFEIEEIGDHNASTKNHSNNPLQHPFSFLPTGRVRLYRIHLCLRLVGDCFHDSDCIHYFVIYPAVISILSQVTHYIVFAWTFRCSHSRPAAGTYVESQWQVSCLWYQCWRVYDVVSGANEKPHGCKRVENWKRIAHRSFPVHPFSDNKFRARPIRVWRGSSYRLAVSDRRCWIPLAHRYIVSSRGIRASIIFGKTNHGPIDWLGFSHSDDLLCVCQSNGDLALD